MKPIQDSQAQFAISTYDHESITVNHVKHYQALAIHSLEGIATLPFKAVCEINADWLTDCFIKYPELQLILVDTGPSQQWLAPELIALCHQHRIAIETMTTPAIYRHFSFLANESFNTLGVFTSHATSGDL